MSEQNVTTVSRRYEREDKKRKKALLILLSLLMIGSLSGSLYGYWAENITAPDDEEKNNNTANIGTAKAITGDLEVTTDFTVNENLVPKGRTSSSIGGTIVEEVSQNLQTTWKDTTNAVKRGDGVKGKLTITATPSFDSPADKQNDDVLKKLVQFEIKSTGADMTTAGKEITLNGDRVDSNIKVTLKEPDNKTEYQKIKGKKFKVTLNYSVDSVQS